MEFLHTLNDFSDWYCHIGSQQGRVPTQMQGRKTGTTKEGVGGAGPTWMKMWSSPGQDLVAYLKFRPGIQAHWVLYHLVWSAWLSALPTCQHISSHCSRCRAFFTWPPWFVHKVYISLKSMWVFFTSSFMFHNVQCPFSMGYSLSFFAFQCDGQHQRILFKWRAERILNFHTRLETESCSFEIIYGERSLNF